MVQGLKQDSNPQILNDMACALPAGQQRLKLEYDGCAKPNFGLQASQVKIFRPENETKTKPKPDDNSDKSFKGGFDDSELVNDDVMRDREVKEVKVEDRKAEDQMVNDVSKRKRKHRNKASKNLFV